MCVNCSVHLIEVMISGLTSLHSSTSMKKRSNLDMMGADMLTFCFRDLARLYLPSMGLAAARMEVRAFRVALNTQKWLDMVDYGLNRQCF